MVIAFLPRSKHLSIWWLLSPSTVILEPKKIKFVTLSIVSPSICHEVMGLDAMIFIFWILSLKPAFSLSSFTFIKRLFSSSLLSALRVVSSGYLWLLIFLLAILIPACASSSPAFQMMYSANKLNKQGDDIQPWCTPFPMWNQSIVPHLVLTVVSWPAYRSVTCSRWFLPILAMCRNLASLRQNPENAVKVAASLPALQLGFRPVMRVYNQIHPSNIDSDVRNLRSDAKPIFLGRVTAEASGFVGSH